MNIEKLKEFAATIKHCGDYGELWINKDTNSVWWVCGDADFDEYEVEHDLCSSYEYVKNGFKSVEGVLEVDIEPETSMKGFDGWESLGKFGIDNWDEAEQHYKNLKDIILYEY